MSKTNIILVSTRKVSVPLADMIQKSSHLTFDYSGGSMNQKPFRSTQKSFRSTKKSLKSTQKSLKLFVKIIKIKSKDHLDQILKSLDQP